MRELIQAGQQTYYIKGFTNAGIYRQGENEVYVIDPGTDENEGREVEEVLQSKGWKLKGILCTHCHSDHTGANAYLQDKYGCPVFAYGMEAVFINNSILDLMVAYGGHPIDEILGSDIYAESCVCFDTDHAEFPKEIEVVMLPGHSMEHVGYRLPDGTFFVGDTLIESRIIRKYPLSYIYNPEEVLKTLDNMKSMEASVFVPSHAEPVSDISELIEANKENIYEISGMVLDMCETPADMEEITNGIFNRCGVRMNCEKYILIMGIVRTYIGWLKKSGRLEYFVQDNRLLWRTVK